MKLRLSLFALALCFGLIGNAYATSCGAGGTNVSSGQCALTVTAGDTILVFVNHGSAATTSNVTDSQSNSYTADIADTAYTINSTTYDASLYRTFTAASSGSDTVTVDISTAAALHLVVVDVGSSGFKGGFDTHSAIATGTGTAISSATITPAETGELVVGWVYSSTSSLTVTWSGMTGQGHYNTVAGTTYVADTTGTTSPIGTSATLSASAPWATYVAAYKPTGGGPTPQQAASMFLGD